MPQLSECERCSGRTLTYLIPYHTRSSVGSILQYRDFGPQVRLLPGTYSCIFRSYSWLGLINVYKFPLDNFHLQ